MQHSSIAHLRLIGALSFAFALPLLIAGCGDVTPICGNGIREGGEQCDDGNTVGGDGCSAGCVIQPICGNGTKETGEECDDGNRAAGDGCSETCTLELLGSCGDGTVDANEQCDDGNTASGDGCSSTCLTEQSLCGNGTVDNGEQCDDGNTASGDGCSSTCQTEQSLCGNGTVDSGEQCDDGNTASGDGCSSTCQTEQAPCGNGSIDPGETCDDGNTASGDGCSSTCQLENPDCGNGAIDTGEQCDDGNRASGDGCSSTCQLEGPGCGNGAVEAGETCDDGNRTDGDGCDSNCTSTACGNGIVARNEECDDGNLADNDGCSALCLLEICGDNIIQTSEQCEGTNLSHQSCLTLGFVSGFLSCNVATCAFDTSQCIGPGCGNFIIDPGETCDDGNLADNDGCSALCLVERCGDAITQTIEECDDGNTDDTDACRNNCHLPVCGDGVQSIGEACDDGNTTSGDGCSADCSHPEICGDTTLDPQEQCDDGNTTNGDGCSSVCAIEVCGDGAINNNGTEICDDGNTNNGDCCSSACAIEAGCELEPNNTVPTANDFNGLQINSRVLGFITPAGDADYFHLSVPANGTGAITAEILAGPSAAACASNTLDSLLTIYNASEATLASDDDSGVGLCSLATATSLAPGDYYIAVRAGAANLTPAFGYTLNVTFTVTICGNGLLESGERCDDGNNTNGDGCTSACLIERTGETEPNDSTATANGPYLPGTFLMGAINPAADLDYFAFSINQVSDLRIETFDANGPFTCTGGIDTLIQFIGTNGTTVIATDDDTGVNACSLINSANVAAVRHLPAGQYYVRVQSYAQASVINDYTLSVTLNASCGNGLVEGAEECDGAAACDANCDRIQVCGDGFVDAPEQCDDGNTTSGDGCDATCLIEGVCGDGFVNIGEACDDGNLTDGDGCSSACAVEAGHAFESEANGSIATADGPYAANTLAHGAITPIGDLDFYAITVSSASDLRFETFDTNPALLTCGGGIDTVIRFYNSAGTQLATDDEGGIGSCSLLTAATNAPLRRLAPGTYYLSVEDYLNNSTIAGYQLQVTFLSVCGDNVTGSTEQCDDGNTIDDATCNANCTLPACGDGVVGNTPGETCDDGNTTSGDGCDSNCRPTGCGNGVITTGEQCDDGNLTANDGCSPTCTLEELCGNGILNAGEQCDDGNTIDGDGCTFSTTPRCRLEPGHFFELEPNDDGAVAVGTNDFSAANANGPINSTIIVHGVINPVGDDDVFAVTNTQASPVTVRFEVWNRTTGIGVACGTTIDTFLTIRDAAGVSLASNDDRSGAADRCSSVGFTIAAGATVYAHLIDFGDNNTIAGYLMQVLIPVCGNALVENGEECEPPNTATCDATCQRVPVCGDGFIDAPETCEDGNTTPGDGCSPSCQLESTAEVEPNDTRPLADASAVQINGNTYITGSITDVTDELDVYRVNIATAPQIVRFEVFDNASATDCGATTTTLRLFDSAGTQIITDNTSGIRSCSMMTFPFETAGTYYIQIEETGTNANVPFYVLQARFMTSLGLETEPNETQAQANSVAGSNVYVFGDHTVDLDNDFYAITVPLSGSSIRAELIEGSRATETCEANGIDSRLTLFNSAGTQLVDDDDDGRGFCSQIDGTGTTPLDAGAHNLAAGTYYVQVRRSGFITTAPDAAAEFIYNLVVTVRAP